MTAQEMKYETELLYESIASDAAAGYTNKEWSHILTISQENVVKNIVEKGLDKDEDNRKAISSLLIPKTGSLSVYATIDNAYTCSITDSDDIIAATMERCSVGTTLVKIKPVTYDYYLANLNNPFKKPDVNYTFWRLEGFDTTKRHLIIGDGSTITDYKYTGIKKPSPIIIEDSTYGAGDGTIDGISFSAYTASNLDSILGTFIHRAIIKEAVKVAFASDKDQLGYQISNVESIENKRDN